VVTATLTPDGSKIAVYTEYRDKERIQLIPGIRSSYTPNEWFLPLAWASCVALRGVFGADLVVEDPLATWSWREYGTRVRPSLELREALDYFEGDERLRPYQKAGVAWLHVTGSALLADDMGTGKTVQLSQAMERRGLAAFPALVVCPSSMKSTWARELKTWNRYAHPYLVTGTAHQRRKVIEEATMDLQAVLVVNIEALRQHTRLAPYGSTALRKCRECDPHKGEEGLPVSRCDRHMKEFNAIAFRTVILDEAHRVQDPQSKQTRAWWAIAHQPSVEVVHAATGTMIGTDVGNLWPILHGIAPRDFPTRMRWMDRYAEYSWTPFGTVEVVGLKEDTRKEFHDILNTRVRRIPKDLVLSDLPPIVRIQRPVEMTLRQIKAYNELSNRMITRLEDGSLLVTPDNLVKHTRLLQLSSSYAEVVQEDPEDADTIKLILKEPSPKVDEVLEILRDMEPTRQVAVCAVSRQLIEMTAARLDKESITYSLITGAVNEASRTFALDQFQAGKTRVMLFTIAAGGTGLTMTAADTLIFMQRSYRMIDNLQAEARVHRIGSERHDSVTVIDLITSGTVEETDQIPRLLLKIERLEEINRDRERLRAADKDTSSLDQEESDIHNSLV
jgi:SNF2 family DNA or RNA helicase